MDTGRRRRSWVRGVVGAAGAGVMVVPFCGVAAAVTGTGTRSASSDASQIRITEHPRTGNQYSVGRGQSSADDADRMGETNQNTDHRNAQSWVPARHPVADLAAYARERHYEQQELSKVVERVTAGEPGDVRASVNHWGVKLLAYRISDRVELHDLGTGAYYAVSPDGSRLQALDSSQPVWLSTTSPLYFRPAERRPLRGGHVLQPQESRDFKAAEVVAAITAPGLATYEIRGKAHSGAALGFDIKVLDHGDLTGQLSWKRHGTSDLWEFSNKVELVTIMDKFTAGSPVRVNRIR